MWCARRSGFGVLATVAALSASACDSGSGPRMRFLLFTPHEQYEAQLRQVGLHSTALGRDWLAVAERALATPIEIDVPHREARFLDPARATAVAYRVPLERGQRLVAGIDTAQVAPPRFRVFLDLFLQTDPAAPPRFVASADSSDWELDFVALQPGEYLLRVQPELLRGGRLILTVRVRASLDFPVVGRDVADIRSGFGAPREGGRRRHQGVDIFAPRGTPVLAATEGRVAFATTNRLGGNVVWLRDPTRGRSLYYAHLDRHAVAPGAWVRVGDTVGFVGNTGNARTTPPHLQFGIYHRGLGPVDPYYHLYDDRREPPALGTGTHELPRWARVGPRGAEVRTRPNGTAPATERLPAHTPLELLAGTGPWVFARLPDGRAGYLDDRFTEPLAPTGDASLVMAALLRAAPGDTAGEMDEVAAGRVVSVLGRFGDYVLVREAGGLQGWLAARSLDAPGMAARVWPPGEAGGTAPNVASAVPPP